MRLLLGFVLLAIIVAGCSAEAVDDDWIVVGKRQEVLTTNDIRIHGADAVRLRVNACIDYKYAGETESVCFVATRGELSGNPASRDLPTMVSGIAQQVCWRKAIVGQPLPGNCR